MSLRDQLIAKGLATRKQAKKHDQEARLQRRAKKGKKQKRRVQQAAEDSARVAAEAEALNAKRNARRARETERERMERALQIRNTIQGNRIHAIGQQRFHHRSLDGRLVHRLHTSSAMVERLRRGDAGIVSADGTYVLVSRQGAEKLNELAPNILVFWEPDTKGLSRPDAQPSPRDWAPGVGCGRATPTDVSRLVKGVLPGKEPVS
jgi:uncharacterized protein